MKVGIIAAMHMECEFFREQIHPITHCQYLGIKISRGMWTDHEVCLVESGIGKVNATLAAEWMCRDFQPDIIINTGSAGGIKMGIKIGDFVVADRVCHHDIDISPIGFEFGELPDLPVYYSVEQHVLNWVKYAALALNVVFHTGGIATGDSFVYTSQQVNRIKQRFNNVIACEMEAAAVAQVCHLQHVPFVMIRNVSDLAGHQAEINFNKYLEQAGKKSAQLVMKMISSYSLFSNLQSG